MVRGLYYALYGAKQQPRSKRGCSRQELEDLGVALPVGSTDSAGFGRCVVSSTQWNRRNWPRRLFQSVYF